MNRKIIISLLIGFILGLLHKPITTKIKRVYTSCMLSLQPLKTDEDIINATFIDDNHVQDLYQMLKDVTDLFRKENIQYSLHAGSLLGAIRHGGQIPWDDDMDLIILQPDEVKLNKLANKLKNLGYNLVYSEDIYKISKIGNHVSNPDAKHGLYTTYPWIDIFVMHHNKTDKVVEYYKYLNHKFFPKEWFPEDDFFPLKEHQFGPIKVYVPNSPSWHLSHCYGKDWQDTAHIYAKHAISGIKSKYKKTIIKKIEGEFAKPALPKYPLIDRVK